ncbi:YceK/YidQ family lipoprotein [Mannheimia pernigra]|uniref:YceK/YidQ family lipoprotein n=1 Tax=Mannheimia pernigra TaxID=111844 RepID=UPI00159F39C5|nr:YceK/YidQ family lipoprotein [Mannheimia pernigra]QLB44615.1 YceK/YidQ family lipoprotein [Mannheimia pernigra]
MKLTDCKIIALLCLIFHLSACGTMISLTEKNYRVYAGVTNDFQAMQEGGVLAVLAVIDLPLSFVLDTLLLPVTLSQ